MRKSKDSKSRIETELILFRKAVSKLHGILYINFLSLIMDVPTIWWNLWQLEKKKKKNSLCLDFKSL